MAKGNGMNVVEQTSQSAIGLGTLQQDEDDDLRGVTQVAPRYQTAPKKKPAHTEPTEGQLVIEEVAGHVTSEGIPGEESSAESTAAHAEVSAESSESAEEFAEASQEELAAPAASSESAHSDLRGIEGYEEFAAEESAEAEGIERGLLPDAGAEVHGGQEFLPILAGLASSVIPTLVSKIGPTVARRVGAKLSSKAKALLKKRRKGSGVISVIARLLESAESQGGGESETEAVDEAVVEEAVQMLEVIIGTDDRVRITKTTNVPWRRLCALRIHMPSGAIYRGTGFLIGPRAIATAGHCVYLHNQGGWARKVEVIPGCNGAQRPFGTATATTFRSVQGWVNDKKPESDYGCVVLPPGSFGGKQLGSFGFAAFANSVLLAKRTVLAGFPGDKPFAEMWGMGRKIKAATATQLVYDIDTMGGQSGAPVYIKHNGKRYVVGIHNYGASTGNSATRVTAPVFQNLAKWRQL